MSNLLATILAWIIVGGGFLAVACLLAFGQFEFIRMAANKPSRRPARRGSLPLGPSRDYLALLRGDIDADEYVKRLKADVAKRGSRRAS